MKKLIFAVLVVLLAMLAVTCDSAVFPGGKLSTGPGPGVDPEWVTVSINIAGSNARAVTSALASNATNSDRYEAVFVYDKAATTPDIIRSVKPTTGAWTATVKKVNYNDSSGTNIALVFAGKTGNSAPTPPVLLGIGIITGGGDFTGSGTTVTFTIEPITSGVGAIGAAVGSSAFSILSPAASVPTGNIAGGTIATHASTPTFKIPANNTYDGGNLSGSIQASYTFTSSRLNYVKPRGTGGATVDAVTVDSANVTIANITQPTYDEDPLVVKFGITTDATEGYARLSIAVPVDGYASGGTAWVLQGGQDNSVIDNGTNFDGGAVLLEVGTPSNRTVTVTSSGYGWKGTTDTWDYTIKADAEDIVLTAAAGNFTNNGSVTFTWYKLTTKAPSTTTPVTTANIPDVDIDATTGYTLTIPSTSSILNSETGSSPIFIYCVGTEGGETKGSNIITIHVAEPGTEDVTIGGAY